MPSAPDTAASEAAKLFELQCYSCHTIGQGDKKGPDLKGVTQRRGREWLREFIRRPSQMKAAGDSVAVALFNEFAPEVMTPQDLADSEIDMLLDFIAKLSRANKPFIPSGARLARQPTPEDIPVGRALFTGGKKLQNGGPACIGCHTVTGIGAFGGGTLGPDLTDATARFAIPQLINILKNPNFPMMSKVFAGRQITDEEVVQLVALLQQTSNRPLKAKSESLKLVYSGIGLSLVLLLAVNGIWRRRFTEVRKPLVDSARGRRADDDSTRG